MNQIRSKPFSLLFSLPVALALLGGSAFGAGESAITSTPGSKQLSRLCSSCAIVRAVQAETRKGKPSGLGVVGGALAGGLLGNQVGGGSGKTLATVGGAVGGGVLGNEAEKHLKKHTVWVTTVTMKDGSLRRFEASADPRLKAGDVVNTSGGHLRKSL